MSTKYDRDEQDGGWFHVYREPMDDSVYLELEGARVSVELTHTLSRDVFYVNPNDAIRREILADFVDEEKAQAWLESPNGWIVDADCRPLAPKDALDRPDDIRNALAKRKGTYVA